MAKTILRSVLHEGAKKDILVSGGKFAKIGRGLTARDRANAEVVECDGLAILPPFFNGHCHAAMTLMRGLGGDLPLREWLERVVWPFEARMTADDVEIGARLAVLEMIKSGTVFFSDMYWHRERTMKVVEEMGIRAAIGVTFAENLDSAGHEEENFDFIRAHRGESDRVKISVMPHSVYLVGEKLFRRCAKAAREEGMVLHTHLSETRREIRDCAKEHGCTPVELLDRWGVLDENLVAAHCVHLTAGDRKLMAGSGATAILNPTSNLKLGSGIPKIAALAKSGIPLGIGTDGASSNDCLDMHAETKLAALLAKSGGKSDALPAREVLAMATENVARAYGIRSGRIEEGWAADALLVDLGDGRLNPLHDLESNWIYSADSAPIHHVLCDGRFVMRDRRVDGEEEIVAEANACALRLARGG